MTDEELTNKDETGNDKKIISELEKRLANDYTYTGPTEFGDKQIFYIAPVESEAEKLEKIYNEVKPDDVIITGLLPGRYRVIFKSDSITLSIVDEEGINRILKVPDNISLFIKKTQITSLYGCDRPLMTPLVEFYLRDANSEQPKSTKSREAAGYLVSYRLNKIFPVIEETKRPENKKYLLLIDDFLLSLGVIQDKLINLNIGYKVLK